MLNFKMEHKNVEDHQVAFLPRLVQFGLVLCMKRIEQFTGDRQQQMQSDNI
jgi:hypothetical protein